MDTENQLSNLSAGWDTPAVESGLATPLTVTGRRPDGSLHTSLSLQSFTSMPATERANIADVETALAMLDNPASAAGGISALNAGGDLAQVDEDGPELHSIVVDDGKGDAAPAAAAGPARSARGANGQRKSGRRSARSGRKSGAK